MKLKFSTHRTPSYKFKGHQTTKKHLGRERATAELATGIQTSYKIYIHHISTAANTFRTHPGWGPIAPSPWPWCVWFIPRICIMGSTSGVSEWIPRRESITARSRLRPPCEKFIFYAYEKKENALFLFRWAVVVELFRECASFEGNLVMVDFYDVDFIVWESI